MFPRRLLAGCARVISLIAGLNNAWTSPPKLHFYWLVSKILTTETLKEYGMPVSGIHNYQSDMLPYVSPMFVAILTAIFEKQILHQNIAILLKERITNGPLLCK